MFFGSSSRWTAARDVRIRAAIALLLTRFCRIKSWTFSATARFSAAACTSSCRPCFFRKFSKLLPRCLFLLLAVFDVGIFTSQRQGSVFVWSFLRFLGEAAEEWLPLDAQNRVRAILVGNVLRISMPSEPGSQCCRLQRLRLQPNPALGRDEFRFARVAEFDRLKLWRPRQSFHQK